MSFIERPVWVSGPPVGVAVRITACAWLAAHIVQLASATASRNARGGTSPDMLVSCYRRAGRFGGSRRASVPLRLLAAHTHRGDGKTVVLQAARTAAEVHADFAAYTV